MWQPPPAPNLASLCLPHRNEAAHVRYRAPPFACGTGTRRRTSGTARLRCLPHRNEAAHARYSAPPPLAAPERGSACPVQRAPVACCTGSNRMRKGHSARASRGSVASRPQNSKRTLEQEDPSAPAGAPVYATVISQPACTVKPQTASEYRRRHPSRSCRSV